LLPRNNSGSVSSLRIPNEAIPQYTALMAGEENTNTEKDLYFNKSLNKVSSKYKILHKNKTFNF